MCLGYKSTLPYAEGAPAQASFFLATCRKRERWTPHSALTYRNGRLAKRFILINLPTNRYSAPHTHWVVPKCR